MYAMKEIITPVACPAYAGETNERDVFANDPTGFTIAKEVGSTDPCIAIKASLNEGSLNLTPETGRTIPNELEISIRSEELVGMRSVKVNAQVYVLFSHVGTALQAVPKLQ